MRYNPTGCHPGHPDDRIKGGIISNQPRSDPLHDPGQTYPACSGSDHYPGELYTTPLENWIAYTPIIMGSVKQILIQDKKINTGIRLLLIPDIVSGQSLPQIDHSTH